MVNSSETFLDSILCNFQALYEDVVVNTHVWSVSMTHKRFLERYKKNLWNAFGVKMSLRKSHSIANKC